MCACTRRTTSSDSRAELISAESRLLRHERPALNRFERVNDEARRTRPSAKRTAYAVFGTPIRVPFSRDPNASLLHDVAVCPRCGAFLAELIRDPSKDPFRYGDARPPAGVPLQMIYRRGFVLRDGEWVKTKHFANKQGPLPPQSSEREVELMQAGHFRQIDLPQTIVCDCGEHAVLDSKHLGRIKGGGRMVYGASSGKASR